MAQKVQWKNGRGGGVWWARDKSGRKGLRGQPGGRVGRCGGASRTVDQEGRTKLGDRLARGTQGLTDGSFFELGHVLSEHVGVPRAVRPELRVEAGAQVIWRAVTATWVAG